MSFIIIILDHYGTRINNWVVPRFGTLAGSFHARKSKHDNIKGI